MRLSAGTREPLLHVILSSLHTTQQEQNATDKKGAAEKANSSLTCDPRADQRDCPACIQRRFKQSLWLHYLLLFLITSPPISGHQKPLCWSRQTRHHSFTRLIGAFVRWLLAEKGKQINTSPMGLTGNLYLGWNMSGTSLLDSLTVTGQLTGCTEAIPPLPGHWKNHFGANRLAEVSFWWLLITRLAGEGVSPPASNGTASELMHLASLSMLWHQNTAWRIRQQPGALLKHSTVNICQHVRRHTSSTSI